MASPGMTFFDMQQEIISFRFNSQQNEFVKRWLNICEQKVWSATEWPFKKTVDAAVTVTAGFGYYDLPGTVRRILNVYDDQGYALVWFPPDEFASKNRGAVAAKPTSFTLSNNQLVFGPTPDAGYSFTVDYEKSMFHYNQNDSEIAGPMVEDGDYPAWDQAYFWMLVPGAMALGLKEENDPTWQPLEMEFMAGLDMMKEELLPPSHASTLQYGRDRLDW